MPTQIQKVKDWRKVHEREALIYWHSPSLGINLIAQRLDSWNYNTNKSNKGHWVLHKQKKFDKKLLGKKNTKEEIRKMITKYKKGLKIN